MFVEMLGNQKLDFLPLRLSREMLIKDKFWSLELLTTMIAYCNIDTKEVQEYLLEESGISSAFTQCLFGILTKLPAQVRLLHDLISPHLEHSLAFQLSAVHAHRHLYQDFCFMSEALSRIFLNVTSNAFLSQLSKAVFNSIFIRLIQPRILAFRTDRAAARTALQYLTLMLEHTHSRQLARLIFHFLFGFGRTLQYREQKMMCEEIENETASMAEMSETASLSAASLAVPCALTADRKVSASILDDEDDQQNLPEDSGEERKRGTVVGLEFTQRQQGEELGLRRMPSTTELQFRDPAESLVVDISEYDLESHDPAGITTFIIDSITYEHGGYTTVCLQLINQLLSFGIKEVYTVLIFNFLRSDPHYSVLAAELMSPRRRHASES